MSTAMKEPIVSVAGLRGIVGETFTPEIIVPYVRAFAEILPTPVVVLGGDSRPSRLEWAEDLVAKTLSEAGVEVIKIGLAPTPTVGLMARECGAGGGIAITASHNPIQWNGLKFFQPNGEFLTPEHNARMKEALGKESPAAPQPGTVTERGDALDRHMDRLVAALPPAEGKTGLKIAIDCCNGAASYLAPRVAERYGTTAMTLYHNPDEIFPREAEPLPENISALCDLVKNEGAAFGAAIDPDADRLALVDEKGRAIGEDRTLLLAADAYYSHLAAEGDAPLVVNLSTSQALEVMASRHGRETRRTRIGEAHVVAGMQAASAPIGGEGNGGVILPAVHPGRDAATALALIILGLQKRGGSLSAWNESFPQFEMVKDKVPRGDLQVEEALRRVRELFADTEPEIDTTDGMKFIWPDRWLHVRPSGTEPILRLFAEAPTLEAGQALTAKAKTAL